jgi:hypothetical protein
MPRMRHLPLQVPRVTALDLSVIDDQSSPVPKTVPPDVATDKQLPLLACQLLRLSLAKPVLATNSLVGAHNVKRGDARRAARHCKTFCASEHPRAAMGSLGV